MSWWYYDWYYFYKSFPLSVLKMATGKQWEKEVRKRVMDKVKTVKCCHENILFSYLVSGFLEGAKIEVVGLWFALVTLRFIVPEKFYP